ncbi:hypothetical protein LN042_09280 [Kitasatospora sp. RB6PN24]|uniref:hypothetical protein n=1 Tax=Kitasatospora humi TaxID=2893891 RepID=UPI001E62FB94|nr:hypothetical protein [Kitasatospora humi]MCC9307292.1 hypothetical protein [Kitasatospora humi]
MGAAQGHGPDGDCGEAVQRSTVQPDNGAGLSVSDPSDRFDRFERFERFEREGEATATRALSGAAPYFAEAAHQDKASLTSARRPDPGPGTTADDHTGFDPFGPDIDLGSARTEPPGFSVASIVACPLLLGRLGPVVLPTFVTGARRSEREPPPVLELGGHLVHPGVDAAPLQLCEPAVPL